MGPLRVLSLLAIVGCNGLIRLGLHNPPPGTVIVVHVGIEGTEQVDEDEIVDHLETYADNFGSFETKPLLDVSGLEEDDRRVEDIYAANGFFSAKCLGHRIEEVDDVSVRVYFKVVEGQPTLVATIEVLGISPESEGAGAPTDDSESTMRLMDIHRKMSLLVPIEVGDRWNEAVYLESKRALQAELRYRGFIHAEVLGRSEVDRQGRTVAVVIDAIPGPLTTIASIRVQGITGISTERILRRVDLEAGDVIDVDEFEKIEGRLFDLGVFFSVAVKPERVALDTMLAGRPVSVETIRSIEWPTSVGVTVTVQERPYHEFRTGGGVSLENQRDSASVLAGYQALSFFGGERFFDVEIRPAYIVSPSFFAPEDHGPGGTATVLFRQPSFFEEYLLLSVAGDYKLDLDGRGLKQTTGGSTTLSRHFFDLLTPSLNYRIELQNRVTDSAPNADTSSDPYLILSVLEQALTLDWRDNLLDPQNGIYARVAVGESFAELGSDYDFVRFDVDLRGYVEVASWLTFAARTSYSQNFVLGDEGAFPVDLAYKGGGASEMRGFTSLTLGPKRCLSQDLDVPSVVRDGHPCPIGTDEEVSDGGNIKVLASFEARLYLPYDFGLVAFVDAGQIWSGSDDVDWTDIEVAVGPGLRYYTVIGPIRADFGLLLTNPDPPGFVFHISIGQAF